MASGATRVSKNFNHKGPCLRKIRLSVIKHARNTIPEATQAPQGINLWRGTRVEAEDGIRYSFRDGGAKPARALKPCLKQKKLRPTGATPGRRNSPTRCVASGRSAG